MAHIKALPGNPFDGHTLKAVIEDMQRLTGVPVERIYADKGYQGHDYPNRFRVYLSGRKRGLTPTIRKELRRRAAIEAVIGHMKTDGHLGRNHLKGHIGDAILTGAGYNYRLVLSWLRILLAWIAAALRKIKINPQPVPA